MNAFRQRLVRRGVTTIVAVVIGLFIAGAVGQIGVPGRASAGQAVPDSPIPDKTMVYVSGAGSVTVAPDLASVVIGVDVERPTLAAAQAESTTQATAIIAAIAAAGVAQADIRTTSFDVRILRNRDRDREGREAREEGAEREHTDTGRDETEGFQISHAVEVTVRDLDRLGRILDDAMAAGANEVRRVSFSLSDPAPAAEQARLQAMGDARAKADTLATAAGMSISRVVTISETFSPAPAPVVFASANAGGATAIADGADVPIAIGTDEVMVEVAVAYELA